MTKLVGVDKIPEPRSRPTRWVRVEDGIYKRMGKTGKPIYKAVRQAGRREDGTYAQEVATFNGAKIREALAEARRWKGAAPGARHVIPQASNLTLEQAYEQLHSDPEVEYSDPTRKWHESLWGALPDKLKSRKLKDISIPELQFYLTKISAPVMRDRARQLVGTIYRYVGVESPAIKEYKPSTRAKRMREASAGKIEGRYRTDNEVRSIIRHIPDRYKSLINLMWRVGLRPGEAFALTVGQIDPETHVLTIDRAVNDRNVGPTKTGKVRKPHLSQSVFDDLASHIRTYSDWTNPEALVFTTDEGNMIDTDNFRSRVFSPVAKKAGLNHGVTPMDLRHTAASNLASRAGVDLVTVAANTGHSIQVLISTYAHEVEEALKKAAERMDEIITAELPPQGEDRA